MSEERRKNLAETEGDHITNKRNGQKNCWTIKVYFKLVESGDSDNDDDNLMKIMNSSSYLKVLKTIAKKQFHQFFYKN